MRVRSNPSSVEYDTRRKRLRFTRATSAFIRASLYESDRVPLKKMYKTDKFLLADTGHTRLSRRNSMISLLLKVRRFHVIISLENVLNRWSVNP